MNAKLRLEALKKSAENHLDYEDVFAAYCELKGVVDLRLMVPNHLSAEAVNDLILIDNLANLTFRNVNPVAQSARTEQGARLDEYMVMTERELADLIFKQGGRFNNPDAISVAMHRNIIDDVKNEKAAYERIALREAEDED